MYDSIVIGAGIAGITAARELAERGCRVLLLEQRSHIGGNCYDEADSHGILIHRYGPHIFHTADRDVFEYLSRFTAWRPYSHTVTAKIGDDYYPVPFNLNTLHRIYPVKKADALEQLLTGTYGEGARVPIHILRQSKSAEIRELAEYVYENFFLHYTSKQWGISPDQLDPAIPSRVPITLSRDDRYFTDPYQGMPKDGYTAMFTRMLGHESITLRLNTDAKACLTFTDSGILFENQPFAGEIICTGAVDALFDCRFGALGYRSLRLEFEHHDIPRYQPNAVVNYTVSEAFTRITEFPLLTGQTPTDGTTILKEYPSAYRDGMIRYYVTPDDENRARYAAYRAYAAQYKNLYFLGRLAEYIYCNMDEAVRRALDLVKTIHGEG